MTSEEFDAQFPKYREWLRPEIHRYRDAVDVYRCINERTKDHLSELNLAPGFFRTTESALFTLIVMWADKLLDEHAERGLFNFLTFVEYNRKWLSPKQLQRRQSYPDDHWMLEDRKPITLAQINADRDEIRKLPCLRSFKIRRDKFHGHFDKDYFFDRKRLSDEAPLMWDDLEQAGRLMGRILNDYSVDFDGNSYSWNTLDIGDLSTLLSAARRGARAQGCE
jgi:hypothetical protein